MFFEINVSFADKANKTIYSDCDVVTYSNIAGVLDRAYKLLEAGVESADKCVSFTLDVKPITPDTE